MNSNKELGIAKEDSNVTRIAQFKQNFNLKFRYKNTLPTPPCGPYFKPLELLTSLDQGLPEYKTSSLEKTHIWQPHFGPDLGIRLDLPDQESVLVTDQQQTINPEELKHLTAGTDKSRGKGKDYDEASKPWWLRNTTYLENNPFKTVAKFKDEDVVYKKNVEEYKDPYDLDEVENSFRLVDKTLEKLVQQNKKATVEWSMPIVPYCSTRGEISTKKRSLVRFDEDPKESMSTQGVKKFKASHGIITNERAVLRHDGKVVDKVLNVTLIAPPADGDENTEEYDWVRDYRMEVQDADAKDCFLLVLDQEEGTASFVPLVGRIDMRKLPGEQSKPLTATISHGQQ